MFNHAARRVVPVTLVLGLGLVLAPAGSAHYPAKGKDCGSITFQPQTDHGAFGIYAKGTSCKKARRLVRRWEAGDETPRNYTCRERLHDEQLSHTDVKCKRGNRRVSFAAS
jgi:hypothetical protein